MPSQRRRFGIHRFLGVLFLSSLTLSLWLGHVLLIPIDLLAATFDKIPPTLFVKGDKGGSAWQTELGQVVNASSPDTKQLVRQGIKLYQAGDYKGAISFWQTTLNLYQKTKNRANEAIVLENLARAYQQLNQGEQAIGYWERAIAYYRQIKDLPQVGRILTEQAQAYSSLGQNRQAIALLCSADGDDRVCVPESALGIARTYKDRPLEAAALGSLGNVHRLKGNYTQAIKCLQAGLAIANEINNPVYRASALNSLGNTYVSLAQVNYRRANSAELIGDSSKANEFSKQALDYDSKALQYFQDSLNLAQTQNDLIGEVRSLLNSIPSYQRTQASKLADAAVQQALVLLKRLPDSRNKVYAAIDLANLVQPVAAIDATSPLAQCPKPKLESKTEELLNIAISTARRIQDPRSESFALGKLGHVYECKQDYEKALNLTRQAEWAAEQDLKAKDSLYLWEWQAGRIFKAQRQELEAINAYERAVATLEEIRDDILTANRDLQFDFRDNVEPIYRELAALRLENASLASAQLTQQNKNLSAVLKTIDGLKLAELQNYFGNDCVLTALNEESVEQVGAATAVFSSIILKDRTAILVSFPNGENKSAWIDVDSQTLKQEINEFRRGLERYRDFTYEPQQAQKLYNWIVRPFATDLEQAQIKTLVFIQDGILRSVPMAALNDGEKFLVQNYAIATTPSLTLTNPKTVDREGLRALALGLTKDAIVDGRKFPALTNVDSEIRQIQTQIPGSKQLLNENFTRDRLQKELSETVYPIIHIATHGEFGTEPENTFLVTGNNDKLTIYELETAIRSISPRSRAVELLALTACQTAAGDDRSALGLAGVAIQAGVRSALASLWFIQDAPTVTLVTKFYASLSNSSVSKAEALRAAQTALIATGGQYAHPAYWAPFILIGNWL